MSKSRIKVIGTLAGENSVVLGIVDTAKEADIIIKEYENVFGYYDIIILIEIDEFKRKPEPKVAYALAVLMFSLNFMNRGRQVESYHSWLTRTKYQQYK